MARAFSQTARRQLSKSNLFAPRAEDVDLSKLSGRTKSLLSKRTAGFKPKGIGVGYSQAERKALDVAAQAVRTTPVRQSRISAEPYAAPRIVNIAGKGFDIGPIARGMLGNFSSFGSGQSLRGEQTGGPGSSQDSGKGLSGPGYDTPATAAAAKGIGLNMMGRIGLATMMGLPAVMAFGPAAILGYLGKLGYASYADYQAAMDKVGGSPDGTQEHGPGTSPSDATDTMGGAVEYGGS